MRIRILVIGTLVFASHVALGDMLVTLPQPSQTRSQQPSSFKHEIVRSLVSRGIEHQAAEAIAAESVSDAYDATLLSHMIATKMGLPKKTIYDYIASQALFQKGVDLRSYADVVAMMHQIKGSSVSKKELESIKEYISIV
ncbi:hypothetical protein [Sulfurimonas sp. HSL3-7]|uniref:hypothetical protein n=1 Tax=Sulfonitrofixus jiaomeiensis TaxID=3131938 RepID=UPI0031F81FA7